MKKFQQALVKRNQTEGVWKHEELLGEAMPSDIN